MSSAKEGSMTYVTARGVASTADEGHDDLGERMHAMSKCTEEDAAKILRMLADPAPISARAKAVHEAGLARFAARFAL
ncbi:hypothetical protein [Enhygromyxa salina]|uniref:hypothetical protein n=1 Tax=Enhygromyxa salina TaxID=215803 RepID=UPI0011BA4E73|nr:hypothetical protein [Enhygromyxa salina]